MTTYYVDPTAGDDVNGDGTITAPWRSYWRARAEATGTILIKAGSTIDLDQIVSGQESLSHSLGIYGGTNYATFDGRCVITGESKTPLIADRMGDLLWYPATADANGNKIPLGWANTYQYPTGDDSNGGYVLPWDDDEDGGTDCCAVGANGVGVACASLNLPSIAFCTGHEVTVAVDLKSDGNANDQIVGMFVILNGTGGTRAWGGGTTWSTTYPSTGTGGNASKIVTDDAEQTFSTSVTEWTTYNFTFTVPDAEWGSGGTFGLFTATIGFVTRSSGEGKTLIRNVRIPQVGWINQPSTSLWFLPTKTGPRTEGRLRNITNGYFIGEVGTRAEVTDGNSCSAQNSILAVYSAGDPDAWEGTWEHYRREGFRLSGTVEIDKVQVLGVFAAFIPEAALDALTLTNCRVEDSQYGYETTSSDAVVTVRDCYFKHIGDWAVWPQWDSYVPGDGFAVRTGGQTMVDRCCFEENYCDVCFTGPTAYGTIQRCVSWECELNSLWVSGAGGDCYVLNNTCYNFGGHGIIFRWQANPQGQNYCHNNVLQSNKDYDTYPTYLEIDDDAQPTTSDYNICYKAAGGGIGWIFVAHFGYNTQAEFFAATGHDEHSYVADPLFVDAVNKNLRVGVGSPAINTGTDTGLTSDASGLPIPLGAAPDIGAYEYQESAMAVGIINWNVQQDGNDANGGGFKLAGTGTNRSLQASPYVTLDGTTIKATSSGATPNMTITGHTAAVEDVGNIVHITGGTNATAGWYEIQSISGSDWVVDRNWCTDAVTDGAGRMGGALASIGGLGAVLASNAALLILGSRGWLKYSATPYALGSASYNVATGGFQHSNAWNIPFALIGYETTQGDTPTTNPSIDTGGFDASSGMIYTDETSDEYALLVANITLTRTSGTATKGFGGATFASMVLLNCQATGVFTAGYFACTAVQCTATSCTVGFSSAMAIKCRADTCGTGFYQCMPLHCLAHGGTLGFDVLSYPIAYACVAANNTGDGFAKSNVGGCFLIDCVSTNNGAYGFDIETQFASLWHCYTDANTTAGIDLSLLNFLDAPGSAANVAELTASPWVDGTEGAGHEKYWLNATEGGGAVLRGAGVKLPLSGVVDTPDIAATQSSRGRNNLTLLGAG